MRILVTYYTQTGNTQKIAQAIYDEVVSHGHCRPESHRRVDA